MLNFAPKAYTFGIGTPLIGQTFNISQSRNFGCSMSVLSPRVKSNLVPHYAICESSSCYPLSFRLYTLCIILLLLKTAWYSLPQFDALSNPLPIGMRANRVEEHKWQWLCWGHGGNLLEWGVPWLSCAVEVDVRVLFAETVPPRRY
mmetsp:Transcript_1748/g.2901  ORF Transcript_1748/g.2901 Transcript_1748/m.2901 type:complete len:146 (+) Transcript_1748:91-528(+)